MPVVRTTLSLIACGLVAALACSGDPKATGSTAPPSPSRLPGAYSCYSFLGYYKGSSGTGYYHGSCTAYANVTNPPRVDSIERQDFTITNAFLITRPDFENGTFVYDSAAARAVVHYATGRPDEVFDVWVEGDNLLTQSFAPFDYTGDGVVDSLRLTFRRQ